MIVVLSYSIKLLMTFTTYKQYSMLNAEYFKFSIGPQSDTFRFRKTSSYGFLWFLIKDCR